MVLQGNLEKQIKRHLVGRRHRFFAMTLPGLEPICQAELVALGPAIEVEETIKGAVGFTGRLTDMYRANLWLRSAGRIVLRLVSFKATNFNQLAQEIETIPWAWYLPWGILPICRVVAHHSRLYHSQAVAGRVLDAISRYWRSEQAVIEPNDHQTLMVRLENDIVTLSLDSSGPNLYRRGLKVHAANAPVRETVAAAILLKAGYRWQLPLIDPMCGAGTFSLEAALLARNLPPGGFRDFAFMQWPSFRPLQWRFLKSTALTHAPRLSQPLIFASDIDSPTCALLTECVARNALDDAVKVACRDFFSFYPNRELSQLPKGMVVLNPPYGRRLMPGADMHHCFGMIGRHLRQAFRGWQVAVMVPQEDLVDLLPAGLNRWMLTHGGASIVVVTGTIA